MPDAANILLVDDEPRILEVYTLMLAEAGYKVSGASRADEALGLVSRDSFDVVFLDQFLGRDRGLDVMRSMAGIRSDLSFVIMTANGSTDLAVESLKSGASDFISKPFLLTDLVRSIEYVNKKRELTRERLELVRSLEHAVSEKTEELNRVYTRVLSSLALAMEQRDSGTYGHSRRVSYHARLIAAALDLSEAERDALKTAALLHDIGKIGITDFILSKEGPLSDQERDIIKGHPQKGVEILRPLKHFEDILPAILHHHENYDGSGYPAGLAGERIPLNARIIAVADTYDAILSARPYRPAADHERALAELVANAGTQFDPTIVRAYVETDARYRRLFKPS